MEDPSGLFNSSLDGNTRRAIDIHEGDKINEKALNTHSRRRRAEHVLNDYRSLQSGPLEDVMGLVEPIIVVLG